MKMWHLLNICQLKKKTKINPRFESADQNLVVIKICIHIQLEDGKINKDRIHYKCNLRRVLHYLIIKILARKLFLHLLWVKKEYRNRFKIHF